MDQGIVERHHAGEGSSIHPPPAERPDGRPPGTDSARRPKIVLITSPKGGCGKTTLARALLVRAAQTELRAVGLDCDRQRTLAKWFTRRPEQVHTACLRVEEMEFSAWSSRIFDLAREVDAQGRPAAEVVVIDTPPSVEMAMGTIRAMIEAADIVLIPTQPSADDLEAVEPWMRSVKRINPRAAFVLSRANKQAKSTMEATARLLKAGRICPMPITDSEEVKRAHEVGCTVLDFTGGRTDVARRFEAVFDYVAQEVGV